MIIWCQAIEAKCTLKTAYKKSKKGTREVIKTYLLLYIANIFMYLIYSYINVFKYLIYIFNLYIKEEKEKIALKVLQ